MWTQATVLACPCGDQIGPGDVNKRVEKLPHHYNQERTGTMHRIFGTRPD